MKRIIEGSILAILILAAMLFVYFRAETARQPESPATVSVTDAPTVVPVENAVETQEPQAETPAPTEHVQTTEEFKRCDFKYTEYTYQLVTDLINCYRYSSEDSQEQIVQLLDELRETDAVLGEFWTSLMEYWQFVNTEITLNEGVIPDDLPDDNSLCIVILGYRLEPDGSMEEELIERLQVGLRSAEKYPNAYIVVTGGGTATKSAATEAGEMAKWLMANGIDESRIIIEDRSETTGQNAEYTIQILRENYPKVKYLGIVSSGYHIPEGCLVFFEEALLRAYENGTSAISVLTNACVDMGPMPYGGLSSQAQYVWILADPKY